MRRMAMAACALFAGLVPAAAAQAQDSTFLSANLYGDAVPGGGDDNASGDFNGEVFPASGRVCYYLDLLDLRNPVGVGLHRGADGEAGEQVVALQLPAAEGEETCVEADPAVVAQVIASPADYYVQVTSRRHESGALRGQLSE